MTLTKPVDVAKLLRSNAKSYVVNSILPTTLGRPKTRRLPIDSLTIQILHTKCRSPGQKRTAPSSALNHVPRPDTAPGSLTMIVWATAARSKTQPLTPLWHGYPTLCGLAEGVPVVIGRVRVRLHGRIQIPVTPRVNLPQS